MIDLCLMLLGILSLGTFCAVAPWAHFETREVLEDAAPFPRDGAPNRTELLITTLESFAVAAILLPLAFYSSKRWLTGPMTPVLPVKAVVPGSLFVALFAIRLGLRVTRGPRLPTSAFRSLLRVVALGSVIVPCGIFVLGMAATGGNFVLATWVSVPHVIAGAIAALFGVIVGCGRE